MKAPICSAQSVMLWTGLLAGLACASARADETTAEIDRCLSAALAARPGIVTAWREIDGEGNGYNVRVLGTDGRIAETDCRPGETALGEFQLRAGLYRIAMYQRAQTPESAARELAPEIFAGPVRVVSMELSVSLKGTPYYTYALVLPGQQKATVEVDAATGKPVTAKVVY
ncbi:MAG: hypothetical protein ABI794_19160 [Betaproteobacteria bacterium]